MIKLKLKTAGLVFSLVFWASQSSAFDLTSEFGAIAKEAGMTAQSVSPETFRTSVGNGMNFGGISLRAPVRKISLVSIQRGSISGGGCSGLDIRFGAMEFIRGSEIVDQLKLIAKGAPALIYNMVLKAVAAPLVNALNDLYDAMANLSASLKNSCEASQALVNAAGSIIDNKMFPENRPLENIGKLANSANEFSFSGAIKNQIKDKLPDASPTLNTLAESNAAKCLMFAASLGMINDPGNSEYCGGSGKSVAQSKEEMATILKSPGNGHDSATASLIAKNDVGNTTWNFLQAITIAPSTESPESASFLPSYPIAVLFQSLMGAEIIPNDSHAQSVANRHGTPKGDPVNITPRLDATDFMTVFMCGSPSSVAGVADNGDSNIKWAKDWCKKRYGFDPSGNPSAAAANLELIVCENRPNADVYMGGCIDAKKVKMSSANVTAGGFDIGKGMIFHTLELLDSSVKKAASGTEEFSPPERALIAMAPFPLYEVINVAASSPFIANQILQNAGTVLAFSFVSATIDGIISSAMSNNVVTDQRMPFLKDISGKFWAIQAELNDAAVVEQRNFNAYKKAAESLLFHVKTINTEVLNSTMSMGLNGTQFAESMSGLVVGG